MLKPSCSRGWQLEDQGGHYAESDGILHVWSDNPNATGGPNFYKEMSPQSDFNFSVQVKTESLGNWHGDINAEGFGLAVGSTLPFAGNTRLITFEFRGRDNGTFLVARYTYYWATDLVYSNNPAYPSYPNMGYPMTAVKTDAWYTMRLSVQKAPFSVTAEVESENGTLLGTTTILDMTKISFQDIKYVGVLGCWGGDFYAKNISLSLSPDRQDFSPTPTATLPPITNGLNVTPPATSSPSEAGNENALATPEPTIYSANTAQSMSMGIDISTWLAVSIATAAILFVPIMLLVRFGKHKRAFREH